MPFKLPKSNRIRKRDDIQSLFKSGKRLKAYPVQLIYQLTEKEDINNIKVGFSAPKKIFKRAVDRNLIKRRLKDAYRTNQALLSKLKLTQKQGCLLMFVYTGKEAASYQEIEEKIVLLLQELDAKV